MPFEKYIIEKNVPLPNCKTIKYPFDKMEINDSFIVPIEEKSTLHSAIVTARKTGRTFTVKKVDSNTLRCWRLS